MQNPLFLALDISFAQLLKTLTIPRNFLVRFPTVASFSKVLSFSSTQQTPGCEVGIYYLFLTHTREKK